MHPWHDISVGKNAPTIVNMIVEIPKDSCIKYELDKVSGLLRLDRFLYSAVHYGGDYGFIPQTLAEDNDPLDVYVISNSSVFPLTLCEVKILGIIRMVDSKENDDKVIGVHAHDPRYSEWDKIEDVPKHMIKEIINFFETYKEMEGKEVNIQKMLGKEEAYTILNESQKRYADKFSRIV